VALVESFLGEFKPDDESTSEPPTPDKINIKKTVDIKEELATDVPQPSIEENILVSDSQISVELETKVSTEMKEKEVKEVVTADIPVPTVKSDVATEETVESVAPVVEQPSRPLTPPPQPPPVKRKVK